MKKSMLVLSMIAIVAMLGMGTQAVADELVPGAATHVDQSVMGVGKTIMQMGASDRAHTNMVNAKSRATYNVNDNTGINTDHQFGQSQTDQSWKAIQSVQEAPVRGLVAGDCQGDNSDGKYRAQMNQNRDGYMAEPLVPNETCGDNHPTYK